MNHHIFVLTGKSSTGKDRMYRELLEDESLKLKNVVLYTTRPMRSGEEEGLQYHFIDEAAYEKWHAGKKIVEERTYDTMAGLWRYFTADDGQIDLASSDYLMIGTPESVISLLAYYGKDAVVPIYIDTDDGIRLERALNRERKQEKPRYDEMCRRYLADMSDFSEEKLEQACVKARFSNNDSPEDCLARIKEYILTY